MGWDVHAQLTYYIGNVPSSTPSVSAQDAITTAEQTLDGTYDSAQATSLKYLALEDGSVALTHAIRVRVPSTGDTYEAYVDAHENKLLSVHSFTARSSVNIHSFYDLPGENM